MANDIKDNRKKYWIDFGATILERKSMKRRNIIQKSFFFVAKIIIQYIFVWAELQKKKSMKSVEERQYSDQ